MLTHQFTLENQLIISTTKQQILKIYVSQYVKKDLLQTLLHKNFSSTNICIGTEQLTHHYDLKYSIPKIFDLIKHSSANQYLYKCGYYLKTLALSQSLKTMINMPTSLKFRLVSLM